MTTNNYKQQYIECIRKAKNAIQDNKNIIICGPEYSGKTHMQKELKELLKSYDVYYGVQEYHYRNRQNGRHYNTNNFWIEEINKDIISNVIDDYEYISTPIKYQTV